MQCKKNLCFIDSVCSVIPKPHTLFGASLPFVNCSNYAERTNKWSSTCYRTKLSSLCFTSSWTISCVVSSETEWRALEGPNKDIPDWLVSSLQKFGFEHANVVQKRTIPAILSGKDVILTAPTGSGKTLAFLVPILAGVDFKKPYVQALIVVPTPELGFQIYLTAKHLSISQKYSRGNTKNHLIFPLLGVDRERQRHILKTVTPAVIVGTFDDIKRWLDHMDLERVKYLVLDEFDDYLLCSSNKSKILRLLKATNMDRQTVFTSATLKQSEYFLKQCRQQKWTKDIERIQVTQVEWLPNLVHYYHLVRCSDRIKSLIAILRQQLPKRAILFIKVGSNLEQVVSRLEMEWKERLTAEDAHQLSVVSLSSCSIGEVVKGHCKVMTDEMTRGLDIPEVTHIYNLDLAYDGEAYIHRAGRTARWKRKGFVLSLIGEKELFALKRLENELGIPFKEWK
eukprot:jgi/Galph1/5926/GphlegSOOS_G4586.1